MPQIHVRQHSATYGQELKRPGEGRTFIVIAITAVMIAGRQIPLVSRQTELRDRYRDPAAVRRAYGAGPGSRARTGTFQCRRARPADSALPAAMRAGHDIAELSGAAGWFCEVPPRSASNPEPHPLCPVPNTRNRRSLRSAEPGARATTLLYYQSE